MSDVNPDIFYQAASVWNELTEYNYLMATKINFIKLTLPSHLKTFPILQASNILKILPFQDSIPKSHPAAPRNIIYPYNLSLLSFSATIFCLIESPPDTILSKYLASSSMCISRDCAIWYSPSPILLK